MAFTISENVAVRGISTCVPSSVHDINDYSLFTETEKKNFIHTVGVQKRRFVSEGICSSDLSVAAAQKLIDALNWDKNDIDAIILVTQSGDYPIPSTAFIIQDHLQLPDTCIAFDINLGCSGYVIGLQTISSMMGKNKFKKVILLATDVPSINLSYHDKSTYPLFGDGASATALEYDECAKNMYFITQSNGRDFDALYIPHGGMRNFAGPHSFEEIEYEGGIKRNMTHIVLDGMRIFNFSITKVPPQIITLMELCGNSIDEIDYFFTHQANKIMNETIRKKLKIQADRFPYSIQEYGNTSSASIPITMSHILGDPNKMYKGETVLSGFGIGLSWASAYISFENTLILPVSDYE
ncbi:MAG: ketoacyl-ACP synthase III [Marinilabiliales bacterium]|nr:MAG: ketoacyl-ACP synthase III [Marinilabiliales bacterium]